MAAVQAALERGGPLPDPTGGASLGIARAAGISAFRAMRESVQRPRLRGRYAAEVRLLCASLADCDRKWEHLSNLLATCCLK